MAPTSQPGIFALGTRSHHHLHLDVHLDARPGGEGNGLTDFSRSTGGAWCVAPSVEAFADWRSAS